MQLKDDRLIRQSTKYAGEERGGFNSFSAILLVEFGQEIKILDNAISCVKPMIISSFNC